MICKDTELIHESQFNTIDQLGESDHVAYKQLFEQLKIQQQELANQREQLDQAISDKQLLNQNVIEVNLV